MVQDPYSVLGVAHGATPEEIKKAYRKKAKEYHPDLHPGDPEAARKMNEVNEAFDILQKPEKYETNRDRQRQYQSADDPNGQRADTQYRSGNREHQSYDGYRGSGSWTSDFEGFNFDDFFGFGFRDAQVDTSPRPQPEDPPELRSAIQAVNSRRYLEATETLSRMTSTYRNARWYYVCAVAWYGLGDVAKAQDLLGRAIQMDPDNRIYVQLYRQYRETGQEQARNNTQVSLSPLRMLSRVAIGLLAARFFFGLIQALVYGMQFAH